MGDVAHAMGDYVFTDATSGDKVRVEYTFCYKRCDDGKVRICLHHSSVPYEAKPAPVTEAEVLEARKLWADSIASISKANVERDWESSPHAQTVASRGSGLSNPCRVCVAAPTYH